jgi:hypothetical protein
MCMSTIFCPLNKASFPPPFLPFQHQLHINNQNPFQTPLLKNLIRNQVTKEMHTPSIMKCLNTLLSIIIFFSLSVQSLPITPSFDEVSGIRSTSSNLSSNYGSLVIRQDVPTLSPYAKSAPANEHI